MSSVCCPELLSQSSMDAVHCALVTLQSEREQLDQFVEGLLDELETVRCTLQRKDDQLASEHSDLARARADMEQLRATLVQQQDADNQQQQHELARLQQDLAASHEERSRLVSEREELTVALERARGQIRELEERVAGLEEERRTIQATLDKATEELDQLANVRETLQATQSQLETLRQQQQQRENSLSAELAQAQKQNDVLTKQLDEWKQAAASSNPSDTECLDTSSRQVQQYEEKLAKEQAKNEAIAKELATLRNRFEAQRQEYLDEVRILRESLTGHDIPFSAMELFDGDAPSGTFGGDDPPVPKRTAGQEKRAPEEEENKPVAPVDRVVGSVLQQLQRMSSNKQESRS